MPSGARAFYRCGALASAAASSRAVSVNTGPWAGCDAYAEHSCLTLPLAGSANSGAWVVGWWRASTTLGTAPPLARAPSNGAQQRGARRDGRGSVTLTAVAGLWDTVKGSAVRRHVSSCLLLL